jgi:AcrR family transcriptional regulator
MKETTGSGKSAAEARILSTAASQFALFGYNGVSTRDIAAGAGVNEVTIYRHYPRKRNLYLAVLDAELGKVNLRGDLLARIAEAGDGRTALVCTFELIAGTLTSSPELLRLLQYGALEVSEDLDPLLRRHLGELIKVLSRYLDPWIGAGHLRCASSEALVLTLIAIVLSHRPLHRVFPSGVSGHENLFEAYAGICVA